MTGQMSCSYCRLSKLLAQHLPSPRRKRLLLSVKWFPTLLPVGVGRHCCVQRCALPSFLVTLSNHTLPMQVSLKTQTSYCDDVTYVMSLPTLWQMKHFLGWNTIVSHSSLVVKLLLLVFVHQKAFNETLAHNLHSLHDGEKCCLK